MVAVNQRGHLITVVIHWMSRQEVRVQELVERSDERDSTLEYNDLGTSALFMLKLS